MNPIRSTLTTPAMVIDWPMVLSDMQWLLGEAVDGFPDQRTPVGTRAMATQLGVDRELVRNWLNGTEPKHKDGEMLIARWCALTCKARTFLPMTRPVFSSRRV